MICRDSLHRLEEVVTKSTLKFLKEAEVLEPHDRIERMVSMEPTKDPQHGDLTTNIAMRLASLAKKPPQEVASGIAVYIQEVLIKQKGLSEIKVETKGGFINFRLPVSFYIGILQDIHSEKDNFGKNNTGKDEHINLEYVSANPTGPLTIAHGRQAAIGDALSRILKFNGYKVTNEYYLNDYGRQIKLLGESVRVRYFNLFGRHEEMPEDGYIGGYIIDIAREIKDKKGDLCLTRDEKTDKFFRDYAVEYMMKLIREDLGDFRVNFDVWTSQAGIEERKEVDDTLNLLGDKGYIYEDGGAKWFASTKLGDDKDRVVVKSEGSFTYLAPDMAYHYDKYRRGFTRLIDLLGPDHHGYIKRMKAAVQAMGHDKRSLDILIVQLVTLLRGGQTVSMSTRRGEFISLREIIDEIGTDVARYCFLSRKLDSHLDFDIEVAKAESADNPVYYIQYAHARICSIKKFAKEKKARLLITKTDLDLLSGAAEVNLMRKLGEFPEIVKLSACDLEPNKIVVYLNELARVFHSFYTECRVVTDDMMLTKARLYLVECTRIILANGLNLLNISLPEKM